MNVTNRKCVVIFGATASILDEFYRLAGDATIDLILVGRGLNRIRRSKGKCIRLELQPDFAKLDKCCMIAEQLNEQVDHYQKENISFVFAQGLIVRALFMHQTFDQITQQIDINLSYPMAMIHALIKQSEAYLNSNWILFSSLSVGKEKTAVIPYATTKLALESFCLGLQDEINALRKSGLVSCVQILILDGGMSSGMPAYIRQRIEASFETSFSDKESLARHLLSLIDRSIGEHKVLQR